MILRDIKNMDFVFYKEFFEHPSTIINTNFIKYLYHR